MRKPKVFSRLAAAVRTPGRGFSLFQNALIAALTASAVLLVSALGVDSGITAYSGAVRGQAPEPVYSAAAEPMTIVVTPEQGVHSAAMYDARSLEEYYALYSAALAEALGSAGEPVEVGEADWRSALEGRGVYFDYQTDCQLSSFAIWLGSEMQSEAATHSARRLCLSLEGGEVTLYYLREKYGTWWRCSTELNYTALMERVISAEPNGAGFVFEFENEYEGVDPYAVLPDGSISVRSVTGENALERGREAELMNVFGMNSNLAQGYTEADGTDVYLEGSATMRLGANGVLRYTNRPDEPAAGPDLSPTDAVELTQRMLLQTVGGQSGVASLRLSYIFLDTSTHEYTVRYDYETDGLPVVLRGRECAAEFTLRSTTVTSAEIVFRSYGYTGGSETPLPAALAAVTAQTLGGGEPRLVYTDAYDSVTADWIIV